jgi:hypothetical protein
MGAVNSSNRLVLSIIVGGVVWFAQAAFDIGSGFK